jgi:DNA-binding NtrC family response regulator
LIVASNRPLEGEVEAGRFRSDLYHRLNVVQFAVPPLRERVAVIRPLAETFLTECCARHGRPVPRLSSEALAVLEAYHWPGNIRDLRNVVEQVVVFGSGPTVELCDLPDRLRSSAGASNVSQEETGGGNGLAKARRDAEKGRLIEALRRNNDNRSSAAAELGISRVTLYKKLHKYGLFQQP